MIPAVRPSRNHRSLHARLFGSANLTASARCSIVVAHPADEIAGAGGLISKLKDVFIFHATDGAALNGTEIRNAGFSKRAEYAEARKTECIAALSLVNVPSSRVTDLGISAQQASYHLKELTRNISAFIQRTRPDIVITHPYEGGHPDHDATALGTHAAVKLIRENGFRPPVIFEMALRPGKDGKAKLPEFLPGGNNETTTLLLDERLRELKQRMFDCFETQRESLTLSPAGPERFRPSPAYDFSAPPQRGSQLYEGLNCDITSKEWQSLASAALKKLFPTYNVTGDNGGSQIQQRLLTL